MQVTGWICAVCRKTACLKLNSIQIQHQSLGSDVEKLKLDITKIQQDLELAMNKPALTEWPNLDKSKEQNKAMLTALHTELNDKKQRECNVVIYGVEHKDDIDDADQFIGILEANLSVKPYVVRNRSKHV